MPERVLSSADFDTMESALIVVGGGGMDGGGQPARHLLAERPALVSVYREHRLANSVNIMS